MLRRRRPSPSFWDQVFSADTYVRESDVDALREQHIKTIRRQGELRKSSNQRIESLENDVAEAALLMRAMYVYLKNSPGFDAKRFQEALTRIDLIDGVADGKAGKPKRAAR